MRTGSASRVSPSFRNTSSSIRPAGGIRARAETGTRGRGPAASQPGLARSVPSPQPSGQPHRPPVTPPGTVVRLTGAGSPVGPWRSWLPTGLPPGSARRRPRRGRGPPARSRHPAPSRWPHRWPGRARPPRPGRPRHAAPPPPRRWTAYRTADRRDRAGVHRGARRPRSSRSSGTPATIRASGPASRRKARQPATAGSSRRPGHDDTGPSPAPAPRRPWSGPRSRDPASTTTVASARPLMIRLRRGKVPRVGLRVRCELAQDRAAALQRSTGQAPDEPTGYRRSCPPPMTATVGRPRPDGGRVRRPVDPEGQPGHDRRAEGRPRRPRSSRPSPAPPPSAVASRRRRSSAADREPPAHRGGTALGAAARCCRSRRRVGLVREREDRRRPSDAPGPSTVPGSGAAPPRAGPSPPAESAMG